jgi:hypothetical protein
MRHDGVHGLHGWGSRERSDVAWASRPCLGVSRASRPETVASTCALRLHGPLPRILSPLGFHARLDRQCPACLTQSKREPTKLEAWKVTLVARLNSRRDARETPKHERDAHATSLRRDGNLFRLAQGRLKSAPTRAALKRANPNSTKTAIGGTIPAS